MCGKILKGINRGFNWRFRRLKGTKIYAIFIDLVKAFDLSDRKILLYTKYWKRINYQRMNSI
jgi:hypothetical protein